VANHRREGRYGTASKMAQKRQGETRIPRISTNFNLAAKKHKMAQKPKGNF
jgi:hypothetical protein